jgi:hypothetical protein
VLFLEIGWHGVGVEVAAHALAGGDEAGPDVEDVRVGAQGFGLDLGCVGEGVDVGRRHRLETGQGLEGGADGFRPCRSMSRRVMAILT